MKIEQFPDIQIFRRNTASFVHDLAGGARSNVERNSAYLRVQVFTDAGALDDEKQIAVVPQTDCHHRGCSRRLQFLNALTAPEFDS